MDLRCLEEFGGDPQESPIQVEYMTREEEDYFSRLTTGVADTFPKQGPRSIHLKESESTEGKARTFVHELGHIKFPVHKRDKVPGYLPAYWLFSELCANYFELSVGRGDSYLTKLDINHDKLKASTYGLSDKQISRLDELARGRVGYRGEGITGRWFRKGERP